MHDTETGSGAFATGFNGGEGSGKQDAGVADIAYFICRDCTTSEQIGGPVTGAWTTGVY